MTEPQRQEAIAACNRILTANDRLQAIAADIRRGCDEMRALWPQKPQEER